MAEEQSSPRKKARQILETLSKTQPRPEGDPYPRVHIPIDLDTVINLILRWRVVRVPDLGVTPYGVRIMGRCDFAAKAIVVATDRVSLAEQRYTVAHEIGHALLHTGAPHCVGLWLIRPRAASRPQSPNPDPRALRIEREAEVFAAELLMPEEEVRRHFEEIFAVKTMGWLSGSAEQYHTEGEMEAKAVALSLAKHAGPNGSPSLAGRFNVSGPAMARRLLELGIVF